MMAHGKRNSPIGMPLNSMPHSQGRTLHLRRMTFVFVHNSLTFIENITHILQSPIEYSIDIYEKN